MAGKKPTTDPNSMRSRKFCLTSYHPIEVIEGVLAHRPVRAAVYIVHDKDKNDDGTDKEKHIHIMLCTYNAATLGQVRRWFPSNQNTLGQVLNDDEQMLRYLTHKDNPEKAQYSDEEVITFGEGREPFLRAALSSGRSAETAENLINDILENVSVRELVRRYGKEYCVNRNHYYAVAHMIQAQEHSNSLYKAQEEWKKLCSLHDVGIIGDYEFARYEQMFGANSPIFAKY